MKDKKQRGETRIEVLLEYTNSIIATLREPFLVLDKNLRIISANQAFYTTFKVAEKDTIGRPLPDLGNRQWDIPKLLQLLKEIIPEKKVMRDYELEHKFEQIGERVMCLNARQLRVPKQVVAIIAAGVRKEEEEEEEEEELILLAIEDITERKRLQKELKESEERYRRAFETSRDGLLLVHKTEGDILNSNASAQKLLNYSPEEFLKKKLWEIGVTKDDKDFQEVVSRLTIDGMIHYEDTLVKTKKGLNINSEVFLVDKAKVLQCNIRNITERKRTENALKQAKEQQYRTLIESLPQKVFLKDRNSVYISCNENYARDLKIKPEEIIGKTDYDFFPTYLVEKYRADDKRIMESGDIEDAEERCIVDGKEAFVHTLKIPVKDEKRNAVGILSISWDITDQKKIAKEQRLSQLGKLVADMAHEVNSPLMVISGNAQLCLMEEIQSDTVKNNLKIIVEECRRAKDIIQRLLKFSRLSKDEVKEVDINKSIEAIVSIVEHQFKLANLEIKRNYLENPPLISVDEQQMQEVFMNLINNAAEAMSNGGAITITTSLEGDFLRIDFKDTGCGMSEETKKKLSEPFFTTKEKGTGLGLSVCYGILKAHNGELKFESDLNKGATVTVLLPLKERGVERSV